MTSNSILEEKYVLSVRLMTYNHEAFIEDALRGIDMQKTDFVFEVVVGDDFSTDGTLERIKKFSFSNPNLILKILNRTSGDEYYKKRQEMGRLYNFVDIINNCSGKYIALLDGDDYWIDPLKLQKQTNFLENNVGFSYCGHNSYNKRDFEFIPSKIHPSLRKLAFKEVVENNILNSATLVFRKACIENLSPMFYRLTAGDWGLQLIALRMGKAYILKDYMSVYRIHEEGIWTNLTQTQQGIKGIDNLKNMKLLFQDSRAQILINSSIEKRKEKFNIKECTFNFSIKKKLKNKIISFFRG